MSHPILGRAIRRALLATTLAGLAPAALAQEVPAPADDADTLDRIVVTGTNIPRTTKETASPVQVISREEIDRSGKSSIADYLQTLTMDGQGSIPKSFGNGFAAGATGVSLRGLGAGSTLVLLNGRRMAPFGLADDGQKVFTDLSTIPMDAVERVEVLKDGASSIYGSDAIAGVVNIILRKDFTGGVVRSSYGISGDSDGNERKFGITLGTGDLNENGYNAFISIDASKTDGLMVNDRLNRKWIGDGDIRRWGYDTNNFGGLTGHITNLNARSSPTGSIRGADGQYVSLPGCAQLSDVTPQDPGGGCLYDTGNWSSLMPEEQYINLFARGTFALSDTAEIYTELGYSRKKSKFATNPSGVSGSWGYPGGGINANSGPGATVLGANHPDNPLGIDARLRYAAFDVGGRETSTENDYMRGLIGVTGTLGAWDYDVAYMHSETSLDNRSTGFLRYSRVRTVLTDPNSPVGWWRIGDDAGLNSQAMYDFISPTIRANASTSLDSVDAKLSRTLMDLPGGAMGLALGAEYRRQSAQLNPTTYTDIGDIIGLGYSAFDGEQTVTAAYAELLAPVATWLEVSAALRMDSYKDGDTATTPKIGIKWTPADWIAIRGTYAEGFRAPNPAESAGSSVGFGNIQDPVRCGLNAPTGCAVNIGFINSPNPDLKPETSKSYTLGLVLDPTPNTSLTVDFWQIERSDEITTLDLDSALALGYGTRDDDLINGQPGTGTLLTVRTPYINASSTTVRGIDFDIRQRVDLGSYGELGFDLQWSRTNLLELELTDGTRFQYAGTHGNCNVSNCIGTPKDRINLGVTWDIGHWSLSSVVNYIGSMDNTLDEAAEDGCAAFFADGTDAPHGCKIPSFTTLNLSGRWSPSDAWEVFGSIQNATDKIAPLDPTTYGAMNFNPMHISGAIGRYFTLGVKYKFE